MRKLFGMVIGVAVGWTFGAVLASTLRAFAVLPQTVEMAALTVTSPVILICGAWGGLLGYCQDRRSHG